jgi:hypothetical protein
MEIEYLIENEQWYTTEAPDGTTVEQIENAILADIREDAYLPEGATLDIQWESADGRQGRMEHTIAPDVDELMRRRGLDRCRESDDGEHEWTAFGGCDGIYSVGGTAIEVHDRCAHCGLVRIEYHAGSQRIIGDPEITVRFERGGQ